MYLSSVVSYGLLESCLKTSLENIQFDTSQLRPELGIWIRNSELGILHSKFNQILYHVEIRNVLVNKFSSLKHDSNWKILYEVAMFVRYIWYLTCKMKILLKSDNIPLYFQFGMTS